MKKILFTLLLLLGVSSIGISRVLFQNKPPAHTTSSSPSLSPSSSLTVENNKPIKLSIPKINVAATIEHVGLDADQRMDVPKNFNNVAWYKFGPHAGEMGSMVIAGHFDTPTGKPSVFYQINNLQSGDEITVTDEKKHHS